MIEVVDLPVSGNNFIMCFKTTNTSFCDELIDVWDMSEKYPGWTTAVQGTSTSIKESMDASIPYDIYSHTILQKYGRDVLQPCIDRYVARYPFCNNGAPWGMVEPPNIQYYLPGEGFKTWHCERSSKDPVLVDRHLVFMTYLNTVIDVENYQGGTEWLYQNLKLNAIKGYTVIWPADWTHTHRGIVSPNKEKYIITGWLSFTK
jgi:hypothetical protein